MLKILENEYVINGINLSKDELLAIRPNAPVLPNGIIRCEYDGKKAKYSTGKKQTSGGKWQEADDIIADDSLEADLEAYRLAANPPKPYEPSEEEILLEALKTKVTDDELTTARDKLMEQFG